MPLEPTIDAAREQGLPTFKQDAIDLVKRRYQVARRASTLDFERFGRYYKLFRNRQVNKNYLGLANLFVPEPYRIIKRKTAKLANAIKNIKGLAETENDIEGAKAASHLLRFIRNKLNWQMIERTAIQESRITGLAWLKLVWNLDKEEQDKPWKGFDLSFHSADEVFLNPEATIADVFNNSVRWLIHTYDADIETLKANPNFDQDALRLLQLRGGSPKTDRTQLELARLNWIHQQKVKDQPAKRYKIYEYWGKFNPNNPLGVYNQNQNNLNNQIQELEKDYLIVVADNSIALRISENPYGKLLDNPVPFVPIPANPIGQELYPIGDLEPSESLFNELNDTRNQRMDTVTLNIDPPKEVLRSAGIDEKELIPRRGWYYKTNIPNGVRFISPDMQGVRAAIEEEKAIRGDIQQVTGVLDFAQGSDVQAGVSIDTARGAIIAKGESDVVVEDEIEILKTSLKMLYRIALAYGQVFLDRQFSIRILEKGAEQFLNLDRTSIQGNIDIDVEMETLQDKTTQQQLKLMLFNQAKTIPGANIGKFFTDVLESFYDNVNVAEYYQEPQQQKEPPKVSISLKGDLNPIEVDEIYKSMGLDPTAADPMLREETRKLMKGMHPEDHTQKINQLDLQTKQNELTIPNEQP